MFLNFPRINFAAVLQGFQMDEIGHHGQLLLAIQALVAEEVVHLCIFKTGILNYQ
ncbi:hypothetical protein PP182_11220 [Maribacter sp. PR1]|uniref:Uncharacterized protein n=1 Tax=Maribacter cobaltidurans TaxID=1178778 RepID=A0ABU7IUJ5_9FLAO|nr:MULTISPECIES: hypothetical protein [Maribacter]MDC6389254.1 hypothetical protein [Maribacter sp. PR1]MEE1976641.1 hypothetical protein [Maribacter cobaltidurans]